MSINEEYRAWLLSYEQSVCTLESVDPDHVRLLGKGTTGEIAFYRFEGEPEIVEMRIWRERCEDQNLFFLHFELDRGLCPSDVAHGHQGASVLHLGHDDHALCRTDG